MTHLNDISIKTGHELRNHKYPECFKTQNFFVSPITAFNEIKLWKWLILDFITRLLHSATKDRLCRRSTPTSLHHFLFCPAHRFVHFM